MSFSDQFTIRKVRFFPTIAFLNERNRAKATILKLFQEFLSSGSVGGIILIVCVILSLMIANSSFGVPFENLLAVPLGLLFAGFNLSPLIWINDGLMAVFFLMVGLEIKRELIEGEFSSVKKRLCLFSQPWVA